MGQFEWSGSESGVVEALAAKRHLRITTDQQGQKWCFEYSRGTVQGPEHFREQSVCYDLSGTVSGSMTYSKEWVALITPHHPMAGADQQASAFPLGNATLYGPQRSNQDPPMYDKSPDDKGAAVPSSMVGMGGKQDPAKSSRRARRAGGVRDLGYEQSGK